MGCGASKTAPPPSSGSAPIPAPGGRTAAGSSPTVVLVFGLLTEPICSQLCSALDATLLDLDALIKAEVSASTDIGSEIAVLAKQGKLLPAAVCARLVKAALAAGPGGTYLLSGYPNSMEAHESFAAQVGVAPSLALLLELPEATARERLATSGLDEASITQRIQSYQLHTERVAKALDEQGLLRRVDATATVAAAVATARGFVEQQRASAASAAQGKSADGAASPTSVRIVLVLGGPNVDTESQCLRLAAKFDGVALSAGALMRAELDSQSVTGASIAEMVRSGKIVPAHLTIEMIRAATAQQPGKTFLLEGFPRTMDALGLFDKAFGACQRALVYDPSDASTASEGEVRQRCRCTLHAWTSSAAAALASPSRTSRPAPPATPVRRRSAGRFEHTRARRCQW